jgi:hypothetical protein
MLRIGSLFNPLDIVRAAANFRAAATAEADDVCCR